MESENKEISSLTEESSRENDGTIKWSKWKNEIAYRDCLTISDALQWETGQELEFAIFDRNAGDCVESAESNVQSPVDPQTFFLPLKHRYVHGEKGQLQGTIYWNFGGDRPFDWQLEYAPRSWYPLDRNGSLPAQDPQGLAQFPHDSPQHWSQFDPDTTRIGWRGPIMLWSNLAGKPHTF